jgi:amidase
MDEVFRLDATALAGLVRSGEVHPAELAEAAIARIEALNPRLNAVTARLYEKARKQAARTLPDGPFKGVPFLVKDLSAVAGAPLTYGSRLFQHNKAIRHEIAVRRAVEAGFVILGKTSTAEFGLLPTTEPLLFGPTRNPWDRTRSAGGSSGGSAAAVASGMVSIAQGGDGGGSIRIPASYCGLFGLKPSRGRAVPPLRPSPGDLAVNLCLSRSVRDTARFLEISQRRGRRAVFAPLPFIGGPAKRRLRIAYMAKDLQGRAPEPQVAQAFEEVVKQCADLGHRLEEAAPAVPGEEAIQHFLALWAAGPSFMVKNFWLLQVKTFCRRPPEEMFEPWTMGLANWFIAEEKAHPGPLARAVAFFRKVEQEIDAFFSRYDVYLTPVLRGLPVRIGEHAPTVPFETLFERCSNHISYTPLHNAVGTPAMSVPLSMSSQGLPIGSQFAARAGDERTLLQLAYELEEARPWAHLWPPIATGYA